MSKRNPAPLIGITCEAVSKRKDFADYDLLCDHRYAAAIIQAGGHPVLLPIAHDQSQLVRYLEGINGLVIVGGDDLDPCWYGERAKKRTKIAFSKRSEFEAWLYRAGKKRGLPIFGICYGMQLINVLEGGTLVQHIHPNKHKPSVDHEGKKTGYHSVKILPHTRLSGLIGEGRKIVATEHHQGIRSLAPHFIPSAIASDGMVEAIEHPSKPHIFTVQWHPERQPASRISRRLFRAFVRSCGEYQTRKNS
jgi:putative glutamine amidotransferase